MLYHRRVDSFVLPRAHVTRIVETIEQPSDDLGQKPKILARRTFLQKVALDQKGIEIGDGKDCAGKHVLSSPVL